MSSLVLRNARIWTADRSRPWATTLFIRDGRIIDLDDSAGQGAFHSDVCESIDAEGRVVLPGLIDTHTHLLMAGESLDQLDLSTARSREEFEELIAGRHRELQPGRWLLARGWSQENWPGHQDPDKSWLHGAGDRPVVAYRMDSHICLVNDAVLAQLEVSSDPPGGRIGRASNGEPDGLLFEAAAWHLINPIVPRPGPKGRQESLGRAIDHANSLGLTTVGSMEYAGDVEAAYTPIRDDLRLRVRITLLDREWPLDFAFGEEFDGDEWLDVIGYKSFIDGTLGGRTARMLKEYADDPGNRGIWCELAASRLLPLWIQAVAQRGFQPSMHAIGDAAARAALDAIDSLPKDLCECVRPRIEHAQQLHETDINRFKRAGTIASMQPLHRADDGRFALRRVGTGRIGGAFAFRSLRKAGARLAFGSDWPIVSCDPFAGIRAAVTGLTLEGQPFCIDQNLSVEEALHAYTTDAAIALHCERDVGSIGIGKFADLVVVDRDPFSADWVNEPPRAVMTMVHGSVMFDSATRDTGHPKRASQRAGFPPARG